MRTVIETDRLRLIAPDASIAEAVAHFFSSNRLHLSRWNPDFPPDFFSGEGQIIRMQVGRKHFEEGIAWRWFLTLTETPDVIIGQVHFSQVFRGVFQNAMLGYAIGAEWEGKGLMSEALQAGIGEVFSERGRLHRIQANALPYNERSLKLLEKLGFQREGVASNYLFIDGAWRDHVMTALINPDYPTDRLWQ